MLSRAILLTAVSAASIFAADKWIRVQTPGTEVLSNAGAGAAREALRRFEQIQHVFRSRTQRQNLTSLPVRIFVFRTEDDFRPFQVSDSAAGYYQPGNERDYIVMQVSGPDIYRVVYHEYAHLLMRHAGYRVPVWLNEGTAELFSTVAFEKSEVRIGDLVQAHILTLRDEKMLDIAALLAADHNSSYYNERGKSGIFYAQSWALVHMLNFSPDYQPGLANFLGMVMDGEDQARAFQQAFGKTLAGVRSDLAAYIRRDRFVGVRSRVPKFQSVGKVPAVALDEEEAQLTIADLFLSISKYDEAEAVYAKLAAARPHSASIQEALGYLALRRNQDEVALRFYRRAFELGSRSGRLRYDYATLLRESGEPDEKIIPMLKEATSLDPRLFDAFQLLGYLTLKQDRYAESIDALKRATELQPGRASVWEYLALAYQRSGSREKAIAAAKTARKFAADPEEAARIDATIKLIEESPGPVVQLVPESPQSIDLARSSPKSEMPAGAAQAIRRVEGVLTQVDCFSNMARLHIITPVSKTFVLVRDPSRVLMKNTGAVSTTFACGAVKPRDVAVEYRVAPERTYATAGDAVSIEFR
jgi:tetratricopeptide (TPR) repeat protein